MPQTTIFRIKCHCYEVVLLTVAVISEHRTNQMVPYSNSLEKMSCEIPSPPSGLVFGRIWINFRKARTQGSCFARIPLEIYAGKPHLNAQSCKPLEFTNLGYFKVPREGMKTRIIVTLPQFSLIVNASERRSPTSHLVSRSVLYQLFLKHSLRSSADTPSTSFNAKSVVLT